MDKETTFEIIKIINDEINALDNMLDKAESEERRAQLSCLLVLKHMIYSRLEKEQHLSMEEKIKAAIISVLDRNTWLNGAEEIVLTESSEWIAEQVILRMNSMDKLKALSDENALRREGE